jgi:hypothetical protein
MANDVQATAPGGAGPDAYRTTARVVGVVYPTRRACSTCW